MRNKQTIIIFLIAAVAILAVLGFSKFGKFNKEQAEKFLGDSLELHLYTSGGKSINKATLYVPFLKSKGIGRIDAFLDFNNDGKLSDEEKAVKGFPIIPREKWNNGFAISGRSISQEGILIKVILDGKESIEKKVKPSLYEVGELLDLTTVTNPEESMKGWGVLLAKEPTTEASRSRVPDLTQRKAECAPTAAANSTISLAEENGVSFADLPTPTEIVDGLKADMDWTPANGVLPDNFVQGKNQWAAKNGLPIRTEKVGDANGASTLEKVLDAMAQGAAAEVRIRFSNEQRNVVGGHMVTITGVRTSGGQTFIDVNDPATPAGTETYEVNGNIIEDYPSEFTTTLSWGFVQVWEGTPTGIPLEPLTKEEVEGIKEFVGEKEKIKVIIVRGKKVPIAQVHVGTGPECDSEANQFPHYHANTGSVTALDGTVIPDPGGCGYGKVTNVPVEEVEAP